MNGANARTLEEADPRPDRRARWRRRHGRDGGLCGPRAQRVALRRRSPRPAARRDGQFATDSAFVALIEAVAAATAKADNVDEALHACVEHVCRWTGWPVGHVYMCRQGASTTRSSRRTSGTSGTRPSSRPSAPLTEAPTLAQRHRPPGPRRRHGPPRLDRRRHLRPQLPARRGRPTEVGLKGAFCFPIPIGDGTFAVIECFSVNAVTPDDRLLEVTAHIGRQLGRVIAAAQLAEALRESESRFRSVAESATDAIVAADQNGDIISWNRGAELMFGYIEDEVVGKALSILMPERFRPMHDAGIKRVAEGGLAASRLIGQTVEVVGLRKDGREFPLELSLAMWENAGQRFFSGIIRDISERKKAEEKLKAVLETAPDPIVEVGPDGTIAIANARTDKLFGYDREQILGRPVEELFAERTRTLVAERFRAVLQSTAKDAQVALGMGLELWGQRKDGTEFPVDVTVSPLQTDDGTVLTAHHPRHHGAQALREPAPAPRRPRRADRALQPSPLRPGARRVRRLRRALRRPGRGLPARPRPLQVRQRHPRPQGRRRGHPRGRPRAA